jgi:hypothetical protein
LLNVKKRFENPAYKGAAAVIRLLLREKRSQKQEE